MRKRSVEHKHRMMTPPSSKLFIINKGSLKMKDPYDEATGHGLLTVVLYGSLNLSGCGLSF